MREVRVSTQVSQQPTTSVSLRAQSTPPVHFWRHCQAAYQEHLLLYQRGPVQDRECVRHPRICGLSL